MRLESTKSATNEAAELPFQFGEVRYLATSAIIIPSVSSERREYIPIGFLDENTVITNSAHAVYGAEPWIFGILTSRMHMAWMRTTCGRLKTDYRYSSALCYNTFPIPALNDQKKSEITRVAMKVLAVRERYTERTMAERYDPDKMPADLREAHSELDLVVDSCYGREFKNDIERLENLFKLYEKMISN